MKEKSEKQDIDTLVADQKRYFSDGHTRDVGARIDAMRRLENTLVLRRDDILSALSKDLGKPGMEAFLAEYFFLLQEVRMIRKSLKKWLKVRRVSSPVYFKPCRNEIRYEPFGVVLIMSPWNYPVQLSLSPLLAAVAAGNTVILKPSEMAPASEQLLCEITRACFPPEYVSVVTGDAGVAAELLDQRFDFIFFTGSTAIGKVVAAKAAEHLTPTVLELGGKCPCVVERSADIGLSARRILAGKFFNGGQTCFAPDYVVVHEDVMEPLMEAIKALVETVPWSEEMARVVNQCHYDRLQRLLVETQVIKHGEDDPESLRMAPRIVLDAAWGDPVMQEEIFGPILPVIPFSDTSELIGRMSDYGLPLALYIFCKNDAFAEELMGSVRSGGVCINDTMKQGSQLNVPFGGVGESGHGRYRGKAGVDAFSYERVVVKRGTWGVKWFDLIPPYGDTLKWFKRLMR
ncbi:MAG: aldehyde dehydrogenase family protein [Verrucomicrobiae bacterium]|nr:aldehyde dehydrogenase family protein [Verrucomicrobiae bacterium]NNJ41850.1 aldehyde dehydrogenase family protein [Akkermansiaceae bacterium]